MKKYVSCFLIFLCLTVTCLIGLFFLTARMETEQVQVTESVEQPAFADSGESESAPEYNVVLNQKHVVPVAPEAESGMEAENAGAEAAAESNYCLVAEEGYLIVYTKNREPMNMFTYMPLTEFPVEEQEKLMEGIWFPTMTAIFSYLESYTS